MSMICLIGDPHFANRKLFGYPTSIPGRNTRLQAVVDTFKWIGETLNKAPYTHPKYPHFGVRHVYILGDVLHDHGVLTPAVFHAIDEGLAYLTANGREVRILVGNHDQDIHNDTTLYAFHDDDNIEIVEPDEYFPVPTGCTGIIGVSYGSKFYDLWKSLKEAGEYGASPCILLMHHHFDGAVHGPHEFQPPGGLSIADLPPEVGMVFSGHYHKRQMIGDRVRYIGAPLQHDFGEASYTPGFTIVDVPDNWEGGEPLVLEDFIETPAEVAPRFHILSHTIAPDKVPGLLKSDYYRVDLPTDVDPKSIAWLGETVKHLMVKPIPSLLAMRSRVEEYFEDDEHKEQVGLGEVIEAYTMMNVEEPSRQEELIQFGKEIANKVLSEE